MKLRHFAMDYDEYAPTYAWARSAVSWVLDPLQRFIGHLPRDGVVLEIGCGTGNYIGELSARQAQRFVGLDRSRPMLIQAQSAAPQARYVYWACPDYAKLRIVGATPA